MKITEMRGERVAQGRTKERIGSRGGIVNLATARKMEKGGLAEKQVSKAEAKEDETVRGNMEHTMKTRSCTLLRQEKSEEGREGKNSGMGSGMKLTPRVGETKMLMILGTKWMLTRKVRREVAGIETEEEKGCTSIGGIAGGCHIPPQFSLNLIQPLT
jgi:hypothetical protein